jgi:hypothetical protein
MRSFVTQPITAADIRAGRIRIPIGHKDPFPEQTDRISIRLNGTSLEDVAWNPRWGPDQERSGVLHIGTQLGESVGPDERLIVIPGQIIELRRSED